MRSALRSLSLICLLLLALMPIVAQTTLQLNGLNETQFIYRTAEDSLNAYFRDSFGFNLDYRNFSFGMKFIAELPKYKINQDQLIDELSPEVLSLAWKELYVKYEKNSFAIQGGTISETFGSGMNFRAWDDVEFDEDNRLDGFYLKYTDKIKLKALYGAIKNAADPTIWDLAYGADAQYPVLDFLTLGGTALALRTHTATGNYDQRDVFGGRLNLTRGIIELNGEYSVSKLYKRENAAPALDGSGIYLNSSVNVYPVTLGLAYKRYEDFSYRLQDLPMANYHNEPLEDTNPGISEEGLQASLSWNISDQLSWTGDYAEAWNLEKFKHMNDLYTSLDYVLGDILMGAEYSHIEKNNDDANLWQKELTPAVHVAFPLLGHSLTLKAEHTYLVKEKMETVDGIYQTVATDHWEPRLQADYAVGKFSFSASAQSHWEDMGAMMDSRYWTNLETKYAAWDHTDLTLFIGKEAGGKVCRNGICRYVAPFEGVKLEITTRF